MSPPCQNRSFPKRKLPLQLPFISYALELEIEPIPESGIKIVGRKQALEVEKMQNGKGEGSWPQMPFTNSPILPPLAFRPSMRFAHPHHQLAHHFPFKGHPPPPSQLSVISRPSSLSLNSPSPQGSSRCAISPLESTGKKLLRNVPKGGMEMEMHERRE